jgi:hypothetical protein
MKDFINKLELAFDKQLDKTNYGRNQVKELFLRACIEVLADTRVSETPSKEEGEEPSTNSGKEVKRKMYRVSTFTYNHLEQCMFIQYVKALGDDEYLFEIYCNDMELVCTGWTSIDNPDEHDMLQLYNHWINEIPF